MREMGIPELVQISRHLTENSKGKARANSGLSDILDINKGVRQRDGLAPILFNLALKAVIRRANIRETLHSYTIAIRFWDTRTISTSLAEAREQSEICSKHW